MGEVALTACSPGAVSASSQMAECWHPIAMATRFFRSKVLVSMEIDALASRTPEC
jgi:hypothetical protein